MKFLKSGAFFLKWLLEELLKKYKLNIWGVQYNNILT